MSELNNTSADKTTDSSSNLWKITPLTCDDYGSSSSPDSGSTICKARIEVKHLGVEKVDPFSYTQLYGSSLKPPSELPSIAKKVKQVDRVSLAAEQDSKYFMGLEGDIHALCMIDLDKEGLGEYKQFLKDKKISCNLNEGKTSQNKVRPEIVKLASQEQETLDLYKERLNEYKQSIKPSHLDEEPLKLNAIINKTEVNKKEQEPVSIPVMPLVPINNVINTSNNANSAATVVKDTCNENSTKPAAANLPLAKVACTSNTPASSASTTNKPMMVHPGTAYPTYGNVSNLYYFLQLNLLKNSLMQNYYLNQNVNAAKYLNNINRAYTANSFILNRNFF